jgi:hypothetical protein
MTFTFKLERLDGTPAEPPSIESSVLSWHPGDTIPLGAERACAWSASATTTRRPLWSLRTCPHRPLAPLADVP